MTASPAGAAPERPYTLSDFDFDLPEALIAQHPAPERSASRLLDGRAAAPVDRVFRDLPALLAPGDLLVFNDTQVVKARLFGEKASGGKLELLVERVLGGHEVVAHMKVSKKPPVGAVLHMAGGIDAGGFTATLLGRWPNAEGALFHLRFSDDPWTLMQRHGHVPLPPYITHADSAACTRAPWPALTRGSPTALCTAPAFTNRRRRGPISTATTTLSNSACC